MNISEDRLRRAVVAGDIPALKLGNRTLIDIDQTQDIFNEIKVGVTIKEVSEQTGLSIHAIRRGMRDGWLPYSKPGKFYVYNMEAIYTAIKKRIEENKIWGSEY
jgi:hypothetical protein